MGPQARRRCVRNTAANRIRAERDPPFRPGRFLDKVGLSRPADPRPPRPPHDHPIWWHEAKLATHFDYLPPAFMPQPMVKETEKHEVGHIARSASRPELDVMRVRPVDLGSHPGNR